MTIKSNSLLLLLLWLCWCAKYRRQLNMMKTIIMIVGGRPVGCIQTRSQEIEPQTTQGNACWWSTKTPLLTLTLSQNIILGLALSGMEKVSKEPLIPYPLSHVLIALVNSMQRLACQATPEVIKEEGTILWEEIDARSRAQADDGSISKELGLFPQSVICIFLQRSVVKRELNWRQHKNNILHSKTNSKVKKYIITHSIPEKTSREGFQAIALSSILLVKIKFNFAKNNYQSFWYMY